MKLLIDIPEEFEEDWRENQFNIPLIRLICDAHELAGAYEKETAEMLIEALKNAEVLTKRIEGHWVYNPDGMDWGLPAWCCSECNGRNDMIPTHVRGKDGMIRVTNPYTWAGSRFCPNCGAIMKGVK